MPILNVEVVGSLPETVCAGLAGRLAEAAGAALGSRPQGTWVKVHFLSDDQYAENGGGPQGGTLPVIVSLIQAQVPAGAALATQVSLLTDAVAGILERPSENVHIIVEPPALGRIAFGGKLRS